MCDKVDHLRLVFNRQEPLYSYCQVNYGFPMANYGNPESIFRKESIATVLINSTGAFVAFFYLNVIDPAPTAEKSIRPLDTLTSFIFLSILGFSFFVGINCGNRHKKNFKKWYSLIWSGQKSPADVPLKIKRDVLNFPLYAAGIAAMMWVSSSFGAAYITRSIRVLIGLLGWGGSVAVTLLYFVDDLLWRPLIPVFFPEGDLSEAGAFQLPIFWKLLIVFLFTGIFPPTLLVILTWQRVEMLLTVTNPETLLDNLHILQIFILSASVIASIGLAFFITRGITNPIKALRRAMERVQEDDLDAKVVISTNDELGYLGERFNQMTAELRQKEILFNANVQLKDQLAKIKALETALREQAIRDPLTGLFNRRYLEDQLRHELARASRREKHLSVVIIDLDDLKLINDLYGHIEGGDQALLLLSEKIGALCRAEDIFCRYAGDEFVVILYDTSLQVAFQRAMEWKEAVSKASIPAEGKGFGISFSAGISEFPVHGVEAEKLIQHADKALYQAKEAGGNCVVMYNHNSTQQLFQR